MSDYTPTTEEVRETYFITGYKTTPEQFDRWLRQVKAEVWDEAVAGMSETMKIAYGIDIRNYGPNPYREETGTRNYLIDVGKETE